MERRKKIQTRIRQRRRDKTCGRMMGQTLTMILVISTATAVYQADPSEPTATTPYPVHAGELCGPAKDTHGDKLVFPASPSGRLILWYRPQHTTATMIFTLTLQKQDSLNSYNSESLRYNVQCNTNKTLKIDFRFINDSLTTEVTGKGVPTSTYYERAKLTRVEAWSNVKVVWRNCTRDGHKPILVPPTNTTPAVNHNKDQDVAGSEGQGVLVVMVAAAVVLAVLIVAVTCTLVFYRKKWLTSVKANNNTANEDTEMEHCENEDEEEIDDPAEHVYEEWNPNYMQQGMNRYESDNSLYGQAGRPNSCDWSMSTHV